MAAYTGEDGLLHNRTLPYPTSAEEVTRADRLQLARWARFLPSPGLGAIGKNQKEYNISREREKLILDRILKLFGTFGGWDSVLSKEVGWTL